LEERKIRTTWEDAKIELDARPFDQHRHFEIDINPYATKGGKHTALITTRNEVASGDYQPKGHRRLLQKIVGDVPYAWAGFDAIFSVAANSIPDIIDFAI